MAAPSSGRRSVGGKNDRSGGGGSRAKPWGVCNSSYPRPVVSTLHLTRVFQRHCAWQLSSCKVVGEIWVLACGRWPVAGGLWHELTTASAQAHQSWPADYALKPSKDGTLGDTALLLAHHGHGTPL